MGRIHLPLLLMCALALHEGIQATAGLEWPWDRDAFRNIAQAQTAADGGWLSDPFFLDESAFYNPLLAWLVGCLSRWLGQPAHVVYTAAGPYVDLLGPLAFYLLLARWFGGAVAVAGTFHLLFLNVRPGASGEPFWANPTYSPWALAANLGQPLFCLCLVALARAAATTRRRQWFAASGALLGMTFLAHTAPAALLGSVALLDTVRAWWKERSARPLRDFVILVACAVVVASPFLFPIVGRYHLRVLNPAPFEWRWLPSWQPAARMLGHQLSLWSLLALPGLALLAWRPVSRTARRYALLLLLTTAFFFVTPFVDQHLGWRPLRALQVVSQHHFWFYLRLLESVFVGFFLAAVTGFAGRALLRAGHVERGRYRLAATMLSTVVVLAGLWVVYPSYRQRVSFKVGRNRAPRDHPRRPRCRTDPARRLDAARDGRPGGVPRLRSGGPPCGGTGGAQDAGPGRELREPVRRPGPAGVRAIDLAAAPPGGPARGRAENRQETQHRLSRPRDP